MTSHAASPAVKMPNIGWKDSPQSPDPPEERAYTLPLVKSRTRRLYIPASSILDLGSDKLHLVRVTGGDRLTRSYSGSEVSFMEIAVVLPQVRFLGAQVMPRLLPDFLPPAQNRRHPLQWAASAIICAHTWRLRSWLVTQSSSIYREQSWVKTVLFRLQPMAGREAISSSVGSVVSRSGLM